LRNFFATYFRTFTALFRTFSAIYGSNGKGEHEQKPLFDPNGFESKTILKNYGGTAVFIGEMEIDADRSK
jgi:hypothetical protein